VRAEAKRARGNFYVCARAGEGDSRDSVRQGARDTPCTMANRRPGGFVWSFSRVLSGSFLGLLYACTAVRSYLRCSAGDGVAGCIEQ
jgi:hypothetical protein